jgi:hypothetical protein
MFRLLLILPTVTNTDPVVAAAGTLAVIALSDQVSVAALLTPEKFSVLVPLVPPNPLPLIWIGVLGVALEGEIDVTIGEMTLKFTVESLDAPPTITTTGPGPLLAEAGTLAAICVSDHPVTVAVTPLNLTELVPWVAPKPLPLIWTGDPGTPLVG